MDITQLLGGAQDAVTVRRVFGEAYERDDATVIPVARVAGGGGGGQGGPADEQQGSGMGYGLKAEPAGVYVIKDGTVRWEPAIDVNRLVLGFQVLALSLVLLLRTVIKRGRKARSRSGRGQR